MITLSETHYCQTEYFILLKYYIYSFIIIQFSEIISNSYYLNYLDY